jgi:hypothetical protein
MLISPRLELISKRQPRNEWRQMAQELAWRQIAQELARETDSERFLELSQQLLRALDELKVDA